MKNENTESIDSQNKDADNIPLQLDVSVQTGKNYSFSVKKLKVTKRTIHKLILMEQPYGHKRYIRQGQVNKLKQLIKEGYHFETPLVLEQLHEGKEKKYLIIDGGHRREAMRKILAKEPKGAYITFYASIYDFNGKVDKKEARRDIFTRWNSGTKQSTNDFIAIHQDVIPMFDRIAGSKREIPCSIYASNSVNKGAKEGDTTLKFKDFVGGYFTGIYKGKFQGGYSGNASKFVNDCVERPLNPYDVKNMVFAWNVICESFDIKEPYDFSSKNLNAIEPAIAKTTPFYSLMRLIMQNKDRVSKKELIRRLSQEEVKNLLLSFKKKGGRESCKECHMLLHHIVNKPKGKMLKPILTKQKRMQQEEIYNNYNFIKNKEDIKIDEENVDEEEL